VCCRLCKLDIVKELLQHKEELDIDARDSDGDSVVHYAVLKAAGNVARCSYCQCLAVSLLKHWDAASSV
jgi:ankyrin repeat protein